MYRSYSRTSVVPSRSTSVAGGLSKSQSGLFPLGRSSSGVFNYRSQPVSSGYSPGYSTFSLASSPPMFSEKYPHVRYSKGFDSYSAASYILNKDRSTSLDPSPYIGLRRSSSAYGFGGTTNSYPSSRVYTTPTTSYSSSYGRVRMPSRSYSGYMGLDDAMDLYKKNLFTSGNLTRYYTTGRQPTSRSRSTLTTYSSPVSRYGAGSQLTFYSRR